MSADDDVSYDNTHRAFLQAFLARSVLTFDEAKPILAAIHTAQDPTRPTLEEDITEADFSNSISTLNTHISPFDYEIRSTLSQHHDRTRIYALVNTTSDAITQLSTAHSPDEIAFVKRVIDAMFETNNTLRAEIMAINSMQALKLSKADSASASARRESGLQTQGQAGLTMSQAEKMLASLVEEGWFELSAKGYYSLTPRALMELRGWLTETYNIPPNEQDEDDEEVDRIKFCHACKDIVTVGQRCPDLDCPARLHTHCTQKMFRAQGGAERCPLCETAWRDAPAVGEKAASGARRSTANGTSSGNNARRRADGMTSNGAGAAADDGSDEDSRDDSEV